MFKVMIVDDEPYIRQGLKIIIPWENYGFQVVYEVSNGLDALKILEMDPVDLVFIDIKMPGLSGIEVIEQMANRITMNIKFVILSGYFEYEYAKTAIRCNVIDYMLKPVQKEELIHLLQGFESKYHDVEIEEKYSIDKVLLDHLLKAMQEHDLENIYFYKDKVKAEFKNIVEYPDAIMVSLDYLCYQIVHWLKDINQDVNMSENVAAIDRVDFDKMIRTADFNRFDQFVKVNSELIFSVRQQNVGGIITKIDKEIDEHYMENLSLRGLSEKYFVNCAYLGQIFKKRHGNTFKEYLNRVRVEKATGMLIDNEMKIYEIGEAVGYNNTDYFISKFVQIKGITPLQYRKQFYQDIMGR